MRAVASAAAVIRQALLPRLSPRCSPAFQVFAVVPVTYSPVKQEESSLQAVAFGHGHSDQPDLVDEPVAAERGLHFFLAAVCAIIVAAGMSMP